MFEIFDPKTLAWPGYNSPENHSHQYLEAEFMKVEDYPAFLNDPGDYMFRRFMPRALGAMAAFENMPPLAGPMYGYYTGYNVAMAFSSPEIAAAIERLQKVGNQLREWGPKLAAFADAIKNLGFPFFSNDFGQAPFDAISDHLRGMRGSMLDMYRQQDKLLEACDKILKRMLALTPPAVEGEVNAVAIPLHRGSEGFTLKMLDVCAQDAGFIMSTRSPVDDAKPECLKVLIDTTHKYRA